METQTSARKVVTRSPQRKVGYVNCRWFQNESIEHESQLEKRFVQCALLCPKLAHIKSQPFKLSISKKSTYTPDFLLTFEDGSQLVVEVKIAARMARHVKKFRIAQEMLNEKGIMFFVLTEQQIDRYRQSEIAAEILRYAKSEFSDTLLRDVTGAMASQAEKYVVIKDLAGFCECSSEVIFHLIAMRQLTLHEDDFFSNDARVFLARTHDGSDKYAFIRHFDLKSWAMAADMEESVLPFQPPKSKRSGLRKRAKRAKTPFVRPKLIRQNQSIPHALSSMAGGLPQTIERRRPGFAE